MAEQDVILEQYKLYTEQKEKFVDRSFRTNKFYLICVFVLFLTMLLTHQYKFAFGLSSILIFSATGIAVCILWWINMDSYNFLIKVKLGKVIESLEEKLPIQPYKLESAEIHELKKKKKMFVFSGMQKSFAVFALLIFLILFVNELAPIIVNLFIK